MLNKLQRFLLFCLTMVVLVTNSSALDGSTDPVFLTGSSYSGEVLDTVLQVDGKLVVVGRFTNIVGFPTNRIARLDATGNVDTSFNSNRTGADGDILTAIGLPDGKILIGGNFTSYNGTNINRIARLNSDGNLDTTFNIGSGANFSVNKIVLQQDGKILIAGGFGSVNGSPKRAIARLFSDGSVDQSLNFVASSTFFFNGPFEALALQSDGKILIGGNFFDEGGVQNINIARLNPNGTLDLTFQARTNQIGISTVSDIVVRPDGKILFGGEFSRVSGVNSFYIALLNDNGSLDPSFTNASVGRIREFKLQADGKIVVAGSFSAFPSTYLGRLNADGSRDTTFITNEPNYEVKSVSLLSDGKILAGGLFSNSPTTIGGAQLTGVRRFNVDGSRDYAFITKSGYSPVYPKDVSVQTDGKIVFVVGGFNPVVGGLSRIGLARLESNGIIDENYNPNIKPQGIALLPDNSLIAGGVVDQSNGRTYYRKINQYGVIDPSFAVESVSPINAFAPNFGDMVVQPDSKIIAVGDFESVSGVARRSLVRLNSDGTVDLTFNSNIASNEAFVRRIILQPDGKTWVSGNFQPGFTVTSIFKLSSSGIAESQTQVNNTVWNLSYSDSGKVYICGEFTTVSSVSKPYIARLNADGSIDASFSSPILTSFDDIKVETCMAEPNGKVLIGGTFTTVNGINRRGLVRLNSDGSLDNAFDAGFPTTGSLSIVGNLVKQPDGKIVASGSFFSVAGIERYNLTRFIGSSKVNTLDFDGDGKTDISIFRPSVGEWYYQRSSNSVVNGAQFGSSTDKPAPADYTGDGKTDIAFFRPSTGEWFVIRSEDSSYFAFPFGATGDIPTPGDFDGDGKADQAVFRPSNGVWYINKSSGGVTISTFGTNGDRPVVADYDGDGKADIAIFRPSVGEWYYIRSTDSQVRGNQFGSSSDKPVQGDYTGDGKADFAFFRPSTGSWFVLRSEDSSFFASPFGTSTDTPTPGDYDGDGKFDQAVFRPSNGVWYLNRSTAGIQIQQFGVGTDLPVPSYYLQ